MPSRPFADRREAAAPVSQRPGMKEAQRGWKGQPVGRLNGCGIDPLMVGSFTRGTESMLGIDCSSAFVYGCFGSWKMSSTVALLDHAAQVHDDDVVGHLRDHAEVVRDEHDRHPPFLLDLAQQVEDLRLRGDVERRRGLVGDEQARVAGQRDRDHRALAEAAAQFERVLVDAPLRLRDADAAQRFDAPAVAPPSC